MSGSDFVFNVAKGKHIYYAGLPAANDSLVAVLCNATGLELDETLKDYHDLASLLAGTTDEISSVTNYVRKTLTTVTVTEDDSTGNNKQTSDADNVVWTALGGAANATIGKLIICYNPDTTVNGALGVGHESALIPLTAHTFDATTDGTDLTATINNFAQAA